MKNKKTRRYKKDPQWLKLRLNAAHLTLLYGIQNHQDTQEALQLAYLNPSVLTALKQNIDKEETLQEILITVIRNESIVSQVIDILKKLAQQQYDEEKEIDEEYWQAMIKKMSLPQLSNVQLEALKPEIDKKVEETKQSILTTLNQTLAWIDRQITEIDKRRQDLKQQCDVLVNHLTEMKSAFQQRLKTYYDGIIQHADDIEVKAPPLPDKAKNFYANQPVSDQPKPVLRFDMKAINRNIMNDAANNPEWFADKTLGKTAKDAIKYSVVEETRSQLEKNVSAMPTNDKKEVVELQMKSPEIQQFITAGCAKAEEVLASFSEKENTACADIKRTLHEMNAKTDEYNNLGIIKEVLENEKDKITALVQNVNDVSTQSELDKMLKALEDPDISAAILEVTPQGPASLHNTKGIFDSLNLDAANQQLKTNTTSKSTASSDETEKTNGLVNDPTIKQARSNTQAELVTADKETNEETSTNSFGKKR